jgi:hypothetical protein
MSNHEEICITYFRKLNQLRVERASKVKKFLLVSCLLFTLEQSARAQSGIASLQPSADQNGMAGIGVSLPSDNATATFSNPAQLGIFSLFGNLNASTLVTRKNWLGTGGVNVNAYAANAGLNLGKVLDLPIQCSLGAGYSKETLDWGPIPITTEQYPDGTGLFVSWSDRYEIYTIAAGVNWLVKLGLGYNFKVVNEELPSFDSISYHLKGARTDAHDYGAMLKVPVIEIASRFSDHEMMISPKLRPFFNIILGYARTNISDYSSPSYTAPLDRTAALGLTLEAGLETTIQGRNWNLFSVVWAREVRDLLTVEEVFYRTNGPNSYIVDFKSGLGDIKPVDNLILGRSYGRVDLQKGWQVQIADFIYVRGGHYEGTAYSYTTYGTSVELNGLLKLLAAFDLVDIDTSPFDFLVDHFDLQYHFSGYTNGSSGTTFKAINLVIK